MMKGRLEHELRTVKNIQLLLNNMPKYVSDYYYTIQISKEPKTCIEYLRKIRHFMIFIDMDLNNIDDVTIGKYFNSLNYTTSNDGEIKNTSISYRKSVWTALNQFFIYLKRRNIIEYNPMDYTERPKNKDNVQRVFLSLDDLNSILNAVKTGAGNKIAIAKQELWKERDFLILYLFMNTGMRKTALSEINIEDILFNENKLVVIDKRHKIQEYVITEDLKDIIQIWLNKREKLLKGINNDALFISSRRTRLNEKSIYNIVQKYSEEALGYSISPHKLRGAFISLYYNSTGGDIKATCEAAGHADISTTSLYITRQNCAREDSAKYMASNLMKLD